MPQSSSEWSLCPQLFIRRAGFSYGLLEQFSLPATVDALRQLDQAFAARIAVAHELRAACDGVRSASMAPDARRTLRRLARSVRAGRAITWDLAPPVAAAVSGLLGQWNACVDRYDTAVRDARAAASAALAHARGVLRVVATDTRFQEAIFLNSPDMYENSLLGYLADGPHHHRGRSREATLMRYLQRFCAKNDTASFFGPVNYGIVDGNAGDGVAYQFAAGGRPTVRRVLMSHWATEAVARAMERDPRTRVDQHLVRSALVRLIDGGVTVPGTGAYAPLEPLEWQLLDRADGTTPLVRIARDVKRPIEDVLEVVAVLEGHGLVAVGFPVQPHTTDSLAQVEAFAGELSHPTAGPWWRSRCGELRRLVSAFEAADFTARKRLLAELEDRFTQLTGGAPRRGAGELYIDRLVVYEDCGGDIESLVVGGEIAEELCRRLATSLDLLGMIAHAEWSQRVDAGREALRAVLDGRERMPLSEVVRRSDQGRTRAGERPTDDPEAHQRWRAGWEEVLARTDGPVCAVGHEQLRSVFGELSATPANLIAAPDVMLCAPDVAAIARGDYKIVVGEVHPILIATHKAMTLVHPDLASLLADAADVLDRVVSPEQQAILSSRRISKIDSWPLDRPKINLEWSFRQAGTRQVPLADVDVVLPENGLPYLQATGHDRPLHIEVPLVLGDDFHEFMLAFGRPAIWSRPIDRPGYTPRIEVDNVVFQRAQWLIAAEDLPHWRQPYDDPANITDLWEWRARLGLPDQVFCRLLSAERPKPFLVDFLNPLSCVCFIRDTVGPVSFVLSEMVPGPNDLWLRAGDERFTCELRMNAVRLGATGGPGERGAAPPVTQTTRTVDLDHLAAELAQLRTSVQPLVTED